MVERGQETQRCEPGAGDDGGTCDPLSGPGGTSPAGGHERHGSDGEVEAPLRIRDVDVGERQLGVNDCKDQKGDESCPRETSRTVVQYDGYWDLTLRMPERPMPPPPADMTDAKAVAKWRDHCWMLRNIFGSGH